MMIQNDCEISLDTLLEKHYLVGFSSQDQQVSELLGDRG